MPKKAKVQKENIIDAAFELIRENGIEKLTVRDIAKKLHCSIQPIFYQFNTMEELKKTLLEYTKNYFNEFLFDVKADSDLPRYKETGMNYVRFAIEESNLFKFIFMGNYDIKIEEMAYFNRSYDEVANILRIQNDLSREIAKKFHQKMWLFTHGIASLLATHTVEFSDEEISNLLTEEFQAILSIVMKDIKLKKEKN